MKSEQLAADQTETPQVRYQNITRADATWLVLGITSLGILVGTICGLSSAAVTLPLMAALFSLAGGGLTSFISGLKESGARKLAGKLLAAFCVSCAVFLLLGIWAREHRWLAGDTTNERGESTAVLKSSEASTLQLVTSLCANGQFNALADLLRGK